MNEGVSNDQAPWDEFNSTAYFDHNYGTMIEEDRQILSAVRDHFAGYIEANGSKKHWGLDVGSGTNLYPSLAMLPGCDMITLVEHSAANVSWLENEIQSYSLSWDPFWNLLRENDVYQNVKDPRTTLRNAAIVRKVDLFAGLPQHWYDMATMFFVAESVTTKLSEFILALNRFASTIVPGGVFAAAFMENSEGYIVGDQTFPACKIEESNVRNTLMNYSDDLEIKRIGLPDDPLRDGYTGMLLALGTIQE